MPVLYCERNDQANREGRELDIVKTAWPDLSPFVRDYLDGRATARARFVYPPFDVAALDVRAARLHYPAERRTALADALAAFNRAVGNHPAALANVERLRDPTALVVVGGQQAGLLTGPLYTVYKAITLIRLARREEARLGRPVVPVFWIAGEDHDAAEPGHVTVLAPDRTLETVRLSTLPEARVSVTRWRLPAGELEAFVERVFALLPDTEFKPAWQEKLTAFAAESDTLVTFFARVMAELFGKHGLVLLDSGDVRLASLKVDAFQAVVEKNDELRAALARNAAWFVAQGQTPQVDVREGDAHLFWTGAGERKKLWVRDGIFVTDDGILRLPPGELARRVTEAPEEFSADVVSRPLTQEVLLPVLAFVGGPGEIAYWGLYRELFALGGWEMPPVVPRLSVTLVEGTLQKALRRVGLSPLDALAGPEVLEAAWRRGLGRPDFDAAFAEAGAALAALYERLAERLEALGQAARDLTGASRARAEEGLAWLRRRVEREWEGRHEASLRQLSRVRLSLWPKDRLQERVFNVFAYLVRYDGLVDQLLDALGEPDGRHAIVLL